jgi:hypothetical protein
MRVEYRSKEEPRQFQHRNWRELAFGLLLILPRISFSASTAELSLSDLEGTWVPKEYVTRVKATRTRFATMPETVTFKSSARGVWTADWMNYHEGMSYPISNLQSIGADRYRLTTSVPPSPGQSKFIPLSVTRDAKGSVEELRFEDKRVVYYSSGPFIRVQAPLHELVNRWVLLGSYRDEKGRRFTFTSDGQAQWPDKRFSYEVSLDPTQARCEYLYRKDKPDERYGVSWRGGKLYLYPGKLDHEDVITCDSVPMAVLTPYKT